MVQVSHIYSYYLTVSAGISWQRKPYTYGNKHFKLHLYIIFFRIMQILYLILQLITRKAADQGHPHSSYNLAVGHIRGIRTDLVKEG